MKLFYSPQAVPRRRRATFWALRAYGFLTRTKLDGTRMDYMARMTEGPSIKETVDLEKRA